MNKSIKGAVIATAVAGLFASSAARAADPKPKEAAKTVKCTGVNECKGKGACAGAENGCASHNSCKGKGWVEMKTEKECTTKGGKVVASK